MKSKTTLDMHTDYDGSILKHSHDNEEGLGLSAMKTKAFEESQKIADKKTRKQVENKMSELGKFTMAELEVPDWIKKDRKTNFASTIVAVSQPRMQEHEGVEYEFEEGLTS